MRHQRTRLVTFLPLEVPAIVALSIVAAVWLSMHYGIRSGPAIGGYTFLALVMLASLLPLPDRRSSTRHRLIANAPAPTSAAMAWREGNTYGPNGPQVLAFLKRLQHLSVEQWTQVERAAQSRGPIIWVMLLLARNELAMRRLSAVASRRRRQSAEESTRQSFTDLVERLSPLRWELDYLDAARAGDWDVSAALVPTLFLATLNACMCLVYRDMLAVWVFRVFYAPFKVVIPEATLSASEHLL